MPTSPTRQQHRVGDRHRRTKQVVATIPVGTGPKSLVATPQPNRVYVANSAYNGDNTVSVIDTTTNTVVATIPIPHTQPTYGYELAISPDGKRVYVADQLRFGISVIDTDPTSLTYNKVIRTANRAPTSRANAHSRSARMGPGSTCRRIPTGTSTWLTPPA